MCQIRSVCIVVVIWTGSASGFRIGLKDFYHFYQVGQPLPNIRPIVLLSVEHS